MDEPKEFYVYLYYDHRNGHVPVYVGKGHGPRVFDHMKPSRRHHLRHLLNRMRLDGLRIFVGMINCPDEEFAFLLEQELIARYGRRDLERGLLLNLTDGGEGESGRVLSAEHIAKMVKSHTGRKWTPEQIAKRTASQKGIKRSAETRARMSAAQLIAQNRVPNPRTGKKLSPEICAKISAGKMGKKRPPVTAETRLKLSVAATAQWTRWAKGKST